MLPISLSARYMILSALGFALMAMCVKLASQQGIPVLEIVAARALISLVLSVLDIKRHKLPLFGQRKDLLIARGMIGSLALICVYYSVSLIPLAEATVLQYLHPMFTALLAFLFLKEKLQPSTLFCIVLSFAGLLFIARPDWLFGLENQLPTLALAAAIIGALGSAVAYVLVRKLNETEHHSVIIFYFPLIALPFSLILLGNDLVMPTGSTWLTLILVGLFTQVGQIGLTKAMKTEAAGKATAYSYLQVVFAALIGWFVFDEALVIWTWIGGGLILSGAIVNMLWQRK